MSSVQHPIRRRAALGLAAAALGCAVSADVSAKAPAPAGPVLPLPAKTMACWGSSTFEGMSPELETVASAHRLRYFNGGAGGQSAEQILARLGSRPALVSAGRLPSSGSVVLSTATMSARSPAPFAADGTLDGIPGTLSKAYGPQAGYCFGRHGSGKPVELRNGTPFVPAEGSRFRPGINHLNIGKNNLTSQAWATAEAGTVLDWTNAAYEWIAAGGGRALVWGHFVNTGTPASSPVRDRVHRVNQALKARYGPCYLDLDGVLAGPEVWELAGIRPSPADLRQQALGNKPPSLSLNSAHLNAAGYAVLRLVVEDRLRSLGWLPQEMAG